MAIHQQVRHKGASNVDVYLPHTGSGRIEGLIPWGSTVSFHRPRGSRLSMLINGKQRVEL